MTLKERDMLINGLLIGLVALVVLWCIIAKRTLVPPKPDFTHPKGQETKQCCDE